MAFDYIKALLLKEYIVILKQHTLLDFRAVVSTTTGELTNNNNEVAKYKGLTFTIRFNRIWLSGSLHYFYNEYFQNEKQNYNDFTFQKILVVLNTIENLFNIDLSKCKL